MRIIAGLYKARKLAKIRVDIRPTPDRLRESLFSVLGENVKNSVWLDLFAGSGAVGIEALSRGALHVVFNDRDIESRKLIEENLKICGIKAGFEVTGYDSFVILRNPDKISTDRPVQYFFLDPPYQFQRYRKLLSKTVSSPLFDLQSSWIILEIFKKTKLNFIPEDLQLVRTITCGDSHLLLLRFSASSAGQTE